MAVKKDNKDLYIADHYSKLLVYRARKVALGALIAAGTVLLTIMFQEFKNSNASWISLCLPVSGFGALYLLFPVTERWHYTPWQTTAQRVERNTKD